MDYPLPLLLQQLFHLDQFMRHLQVSRYGPNCDDIANPGCGVGAEFLAQLLLSELEIHVHALRTKSELGALGNSQAATTLMP